MAFDELVGQPAVVTGLQAAVASGRVAHAYLFAGPRGTGKTSAARILAKCLTCQTDGPRPDPCGECEACISIANGTAFDVIEIDAASNRGIEHIRELRERVKFAPSQLRKKVYIIDEVHMLTPEAFNALLKTLEEPPDDVVFVLATTEPHKVPQTILSRCQRYEFRRMSTADIVGRLQRVSEREGIQADAQSLTRIAYLADGALRDALVLLEQARGFAGDDAIADDVLDAAFGTPVHDLVERTADAVGASDAGGMLSAVAQAIERGADPAWIARELLRWFRLGLLAQVSPELLKLEVPPEMAERISAKLGGLKRSIILAALRNLSETISQRYSAQPRIDLELALIKVVMPSDELNLQSLSDRLRLLEERMDGGSGPSGPPEKKGQGRSASEKAEPAERSAPQVRALGRRADNPQAQEPIAPRPSQAAQRAAAINGGTLTHAKLAALWPLIVNAVKERSMPCYGYLGHASIVEADDVRLTLGVPSKYNRDRLAEPAMTRILSAAIEEVSGVTPSIEWIISAPSAPMPHAGPSEFTLAESVLGSDLF